MRMAVFVYREAGSNSAKELNEALGGIRVRGIENGLFVRRRQPVVRTVRPHRGDAVVCWGEGLQEMEGLRLLNNAPVTGKFEQAQKLREAGVGTVTVVRTEPIQAVRDEFFNLLPVPGGTIDHGRLDRTNAQVIIQRLTQFINQPERTRDTWLKRSNNHIGGNDLLHPPQTADYFSKKENLVEEFRIHVFKGKSIKAGRKVPRDGATPHAWVRSLDGGWRILYNGFKSKQSMREIAVGAVEALGLDFGAVDLGRKEDRSLIVLEVNRAPGLSEGTVNSYVNAIEEWINT
jgi:hypothetical protein